MKLSSIFSVDTTITQVYIKVLPTLRDHIPYDTLAGKDDCGEKPLIAMLPLGTPRPLNIKKSSRVTHRVPLYSGSLCVLSGATASDYCYSIPKGKIDDSMEQIIIFFVGTQSDQQYKDIHQSLVESSLSESSVTDGDTDSEFENQPIKFRDHLRLVPEIEITPAPESPPAGERVSDILAADNLATTSTSTLQQPLPLTPTETEKTVILNDDKAPEANWAESVLEDCLINIKEDIQSIKDELKTLTLSSSDPRDQTSGGCCKNMTK